MGELEQAGFVHRDDDPHHISKFRIYFSLTTKGRAYAERRRRPPAPAAREGDTTEPRYRWWVEKVVVPLLVALIAAGVLGVVWNTVRQEPVAAPGAIGPTAETTGRDDLVAPGASTATAERRPLSRVRPSNPTSVSEEDWRPRPTDQ